MSNNALLTNARDLGLGNNPVVANLHAGSTLGMGLKAITLDSATPLVLPPTTIVVLQTPTMYKTKPAVSKMIKTVLETHATAVSGIEIQYTLETADSPVGHDGQTIKVPTQTKRSEVSPSFTMIDVTGNLIWELFNMWVMDIQDPDTNAAMAHLAEAPPAFTSSAYSATIAAIQFDPSGIPENIIGGGFISNMFPTDPGGGMGLERNIGESKTMERSIEFTGHLRHNRSTRDLLVQIAKDLKLGTQSYRSGATRTPGPLEIESYLQESGVQQEIAALG